MKYYIKAKPKSSKQEVIQIDGSHFKISVKEPPIGGKANEAVRVALADYLDITPSSLLLIKGNVSKNKIFSVE